MPLKSSHLRHVSSGASPENSNLQSALQDAVKEKLPDVDPTVTVTAPKLCTLGFHDDSFSKLDALVNSQAFPSWNVTAGTHIRIRAVENELPLGGSRRYKNRDHDTLRRRNSRSQQQKTVAEYVFIVQEAKAEVLSKYTNLQISLSRRVAAALGFKRDCQVLVSLVDGNEYAASHVELAFRDAYLTRADMWRLAISELAGKSMYKGQKLTFMNTIKAQVKAIYQNGAKRQSAFFGTETKPIFRSESARYVLFIQMSKEMWDFDTDGTGEVMFHKVIDGFLPELFTRWKELGARHLVSIILFTRMEYERPLADSLDPQVQDQDDPSINFDTQNLPYKDFYRVLVSDMSSGSWNEILTQMKKDFKTFLRDVSIRRTTAGDRLFPLQEGLDPKPTEPIDVISGHPTSASKGNILEAINVASSQFSSDYIDRDLVRTGLSIIVVTPGTGVFEVDYGLLSLTTDVLIENGVGIDLVCLSRMPLHSVPLFKYKTPKVAEHNELLEFKQESTLPELRYAGSLGSIRSAGDGIASKPDQAGSTTLDPKDEWSFGVPHWIDVSFWSSSSYVNKASGSAAAKFDIPSQRPFIPRVRMYEVQMMGIMENEMSNISIPYMAKPQLERTRQGTLSTRYAQQSQNRESWASLSSSFSKEESLTPARASPSNLANSSSSGGRQADLKAFGSLIQWMDDHDDGVFRHPSHNTPAARAHREAAKVRSRASTRSQQKGSMTPASAMARKHTDSARTTSVSSKADGSASRKTSVSSSLAPTPVMRPKPSRISRQISFGFKGFGVAAPKATAVAGVTSESAHFDTLSSRGKRHISPQRLDSSATSLTNESNMEASGSKGAVTAGLSTQAGSDSERGSRPIAIRAITRDASVPRTPTTLEGADYERVMMLQEQFPVDKYDSDTEGPTPGLSPSKAMAPWLTVLSPWNPSGAAIHPSRRPGRWQHVFPKSVLTSHMKWRSLCSPASVPLTTEGFPTEEQLASEYDKKEYTLISPDDDEPREQGSSMNMLMRELISARFSHGFQVVLNERLAENFKLPSVEVFSIFDDNNTTASGAQIFMLRGSNIHILRADNDRDVSVTLYSRRPAADTLLNNGKSSFTYRPAVRTSLSEGYISREVEISASKDQYDWERLDIFISGHEAQLNGHRPDLLHFWRTRYVLIPVESTSNSRRRTSPHEDNEEEIRLEGIRKLTQLWQKHKYAGAKEKHFTSLRKKEDANPLDILYQTRSPSAIVATEMNETLLNESTTGKPSQLLPDSDLLERSNVNLKALAQTIQGDRGVRMMDRRWHWRLHYNCFIGQELTTWLLNNFRDVDTRDEAVELGNELMKEGLFVHVEKRHNFRDGNFFYQVASEYRLPRGDSIKSSWFGRSVPSTPVTDTMRSSSRNQRSSSSIDDSDGTDESSTPTKKHGLGVMLSKQLVYDVDHRRRSYRPELITLHYDRILSADDCYHLRIDWMSVTPKLIEDAIASWTNLAERNGLNLVEVPIHEASRINDFHPFRGPYIIKLAKLPSDTQPNSYFDASSLGATKPTTNHPYHKAILRNFNFVLDLEAAKDFPPSVDVEYSWGKPDYHYPQYISREGVLLAQITDEGDFLLLANRLYNNRTSVARDAHRAQNIVDMSDGHHHSPARIPSSAARLLSPKSSPSQSPMVRASADVGVFVETRDVVTPEKIKDQLEAFCSDADVLDKFYEKVLKEGKVPPTPAMMTPSMESIDGGTPRSDARRELEAPPTFSLK